MNTSMTSEQNTMIKPLILCCRPEKEGLSDNLSFPSFFSEPHIIVSRSAQNAGYIKKLAQNFRVFTNNDLDSLIYRLNSYDLLLISPLSLNSLAKIALGIRDSLPSEVFWQFSSLQKPVLIDDSILEILDDHNNPHLVRIYKNYWASLMGGNISHFNPATLTEKVASIIRSRSALNRLPFNSKRQFVTKNDIIVASKTLEPLRIPYGSVVTDAAKEEATDRGVQIIFEGDS